MNPSSTSTGLNKSEKEKKGEGGVIPPFSTTASHNIEEKRKLRRRRMQAHLCLSPGYGRERRGMYCFDLKLNMHTKHREKEKKT